MTENGIAKEAENAFRILNEKVDEGALGDLGSRGALLTNAIGELGGYLAAANSTGTLEKRAIWVVNMFDQADTGGAIMRKPSGPKLRSAVEKLRTALNQHGQLTILSSVDIERILKER